MPTVVAKKDIKFSRQLNEMVKDSHKVVGSFLTYKAEGSKFGAKFHRRLEEYKNFVGMQLVKPTGAYINLLEAAGKMAEAINKQAEAFLTRARADGQANADKHFQQDAEQKIKQWQDEQLAGLKKLEEISLRLAQEMNIERLQLSQIEQSIKQPEGLGISVEAKGAEKPYLLGKTRLKAGESALIRMGRQELATIHLGDDGQISAKTSLYKYMEGRDRKLFLNAYIATVIDQVANTKLGQMTYEHTNGGTADMFKIIDGLIKAGAPCFIAEIDPAKLMEENPATSDKKSSSWTDRATNDMKAKLPELFDKQNKRIREHNEKIKKMAASQKEETKKEPEQPENIAVLKNQP